MQPLWKKSKMAARTLNLSLSTLMHNTWVVYMSTYGRGDLKTPLKGCLLDKVSGKSLLDTLKILTKLPMQPLWKKIQDGGDET